jgi:hypothetical protein
MTYARAGAEDLPNLLDARAAIRARLAARSDLREGAVTLANLFVELAVGDAFADADEHGGSFLLELIIVFSSYLRSTAGLSLPQHQMRTIFIFATKNAP